MDFARLSTITDTDTDILRGLVVEKLAGIATRDVVIAQRERHFADSAAMIAARDSQIGTHDALIVTRDESIRTETFASRR